MNRAHRSLFTPVGIRTMNDAELRVAQDLEAEGWSLLKRGWPDLLAVRGEEVRFIEVKPTGACELSQYQRQVAGILARFGIVVEKIVPTGGPLLRQEVAHTVLQDGPRHLLRSYLDAPPSLTVQANALVAKARRMSEEYARQQRM